VPVGTVLTPYNGDLTITTPGTVIDGLNIAGLVIVKAANVTIKNSIIHGRSSYTSNVALVNNTSPGLVVEDSEIYASTPSLWVKGAVVSNASFLRDNIHDVTDAVHIVGDNVSVTDSWLHANLHYAVDPNNGNGPTHDDSIQIQTGNNLTFTHNRLEGAHNAAIQITRDAGPVTNVLVTGNYLDNGSCTVNIIDKNYAAWGPISSMTIRGNTFGRNTTYVNCGILSTSTTTPTMTSNYYTDGAAVGIKRQNY